MGIPRSDGPDFIIHRLRTDVTTPWSKPLAAAVVLAWMLFVLVPRFVSDMPMQLDVVRWTVATVVALVLIFGIPPLLAGERRRAAIGLVAAGAVVIAAGWIATA